MRRPNLAIPDAETAEMIINNRGLNQDYPNVSDILGSDWAANLPMKQRTPSEYLAQAVERAYMVYPSPKYAKQLEGLVQTRDEAPREPVQLTFNF